MVMVPNSILVLSGKGGVLKTSLVANLGRIAAASGWKALLVDLDRQGNLARDLGYVDRADDGEQLVRAARDGVPPTPIRDVRPSLDVIAGGPKLDDLVADLQLSLLQGRLDAPGRFGTALAPLAADYDVVLIDSPPGEALLHAAAIRAAHYILIPTQADAGSIDGLGRVADVVQREGGENPDLVVLGVVLGPIPGLPKWPTDESRPRRMTAIEREAREVLVGIVGEEIPVFSAAIRDAKKIAVDCRNDGKVAIEYEQDAKGAEPWWRRRDGAGRTYSSAAAQLAQDYTNLASEVFGRYLELQNDYMARLGQSQ